MQPQEVKLQTDAKGRCVSVASMRQLTGKAPMLPLWSYGFIQSWAQYNNQQESLDELDNYNYEQGLFSTIRFRWDDARRELTIARREGTFPGMLKKRTFNIVLMDAQSADGDRPQRATRTVRYSGKAQTLKL